MPESPLSAAPDAVTEFDQLVDLHYRPLFRFALSLCNDESTAADLVQQTYYRWAEKGHQLRDRSKAKTWLFTTLHREFLQLIRRTDRLVPLTDSDGDGGDEMHAPDPGLVDRLDVDAVYAALAQVDETFRVPLSLFYFEEFAYAEIAGLLDIPVGTVMSRISRGKQRLRRILVGRPDERSGTAVPFRAPDKEVGNG